MELATVPQLYRLGLAIYAAGPTSAAVRELLTRLEAGEIGIEEAIQALWRLPRSARRDG